MKKARLEIRLNKKQKKLFEDKCELHGVTPSLVIRLLIEDWLNPINKISIQRYPQNISFNPFDSGKT